MENKLSRKTKKTVIIVGYNCNNNCLFCVYTNKKNSSNKTTEQIEAEMIGAKKRGTEYLEFIGGEMTTRPDFPHLLSMAKSLGFKTIMIATNGRMLSYADYAKKLVDAGLNSVVFSLHGHNAKLHDFLTQAPGSFNQLMKGLANVKKLLKADQIGSNTTIVKQNFKHLEKIGKLIYRKEIHNAEFIFVDCNEGGASNNFDKFVPKISQAAPYIRQCLALGRKNQAPHWSIRYVPLCYFADCLEQVSELQEVAKFQTEHLAPDFTNLDVETSRPLVGRIKPPKCQGCRLYDKCEGIWRTYFEHYGDRELKPILK